MSDPTTLFQRAYHLHVVEDDTENAISLCREILINSPQHHEARMLLANLLDDRGTESDAEESYHLYVEAIQSAPGYNDAWWFEENPLSQLAIWERRHGSPTIADILLTVDCILGGSDGSLDQLLQSSALADSRTQNVVRLAIQKFKRLRAAGNEKP